MGCDIHSFAEKKVDGKWKRVFHIEPFKARSYGTFGFLADVRNYSGVPPLAKPRGFPEDAAPSTAEEYQSWEGDAHSASWLTVDELESFNYDQIMEDRRYTQQTGPNMFNGGATCDPGLGKKMTYREFLGREFFGDLAEAKELGAERIVFFFDN